MSTYYVRKGGSDAADGSTGTPWLTIQHAISTVPIAGGHTINVGPGTYTEAGHLDLARNFVAEVVVQPESAGVTITGTDTGVYTGTIKSNACANITFKRLDVVQQVGAAYGYYIYQNGHTVTGVTFEDCTFTTTEANQTLVAWLAYNTCRLETIFRRCTFTSAFGAPATIYLESDDPATRVCKVQFIDCIGVKTGSGYLLLLNGMTDFLVSGGSWSAVNMAVVLGNNTSTGPAMNGQCRDAVITSTTDHALLLGGGCDGVLVRGCHINAGDHAIAAKAKNFVITECVIRSVGKSFPAVIFKGAKNFLFSGNVVISDTSSGCIANYDGAAVTVAKSSIVHNTFFCRGSDRAVYWDAAGDAGGNIIDGNIYDVANAANANARGYGSIFGTDCTTFSAVRSAWASYATPGNEATAQAADTAYGAIGFTV